MAVRDRYVGCQVGLGSLSGRFAACAIEHRSAGREAAAGHLEALLAHARASGLSQTGLDQVIAIVTSDTASERAQALLPRPCGPSTIWGTEHRRARGAPTRPAIAGPPPYFWPAVVGRLDQACPRPLHARRWLPPLPDSLLVILVAITPVLLALTRISLSLAAVQVRKKLVRALIPSTMVPASLITRAVSRFNVRGMRRDVQALLVQWILQVWDYIDDRHALHALYGVFFHFLGFETLRPHLCHLLYRLTDREDVKPFRVRQLLRLQKQCGAEPALSALLACYKVFAPALISLVITRTRKACPPPPRVHCA